MKTDRAVLSFGEKEDIFFYRQTGRSSVLDPTCTFAPTLPITVSICCLYATLLCACRTSEGTLRIVAEGIEFVTKSIKVGDMQGSSPRMHRTVGMHDDRFAKCYYY